MRRLIAIAFSVLLAGPTLAGGRLDTFKFTGVSTVPDFEDVLVVPIFWDARCANVNYVVDDVPANAGTENENSASTIRRELQTALNQWNRIPTSYINMNVVALKALNNGIPNFDFVNELTFETFPGAPFLAASASRSLQQDADFAVGDDIDGDGDSDVFDPRRRGATAASTSTTMATSNFRPAPIEQAPSSTTRCCSIRTSSGRPGRAVMSSPTFKPWRCMSSGIPTGCRTA